VCLHDCGCVHVCARTHACTRARVPRLCACFSPFHILLTFLSPPSSCPSYPLLPPPLPSSPPPPPPSLPPLLSHPSLGSGHLVSRVHFRRQALKSPHIVGLFCPYSRSLLTLAWSAPFDTCLVAQSSWPRNPWAPCALCGIYPLKKGPATKSPLPIKKIKIKIKLWAIPAEQGPHNEVCMDTCVWIHVCLTVSIYV